MMIHKGCGGSVKEDPAKPPYEYEGSVVPAYSCKQCGKEILGDAEVLVEGYDDLEKGERLR